MGITNLQARAVARHIVERGFEATEEDVLAFHARWLAGDTADGNAELAAFQDFAERPEVFGEPAA